MQGRNNGNNRNKTLIPLSWIAALGLLVGCADAPSEEVAHAGQAVERARAAQAEEYAPEAWQSVLKAAERLDAEMAAQEQRSGFARSYYEARRLAQEAGEAAEQAFQEAAIGKEVAREEATMLIAEVREQLDEVKPAIERAAIESALHEADSALVAADYATARARAQAAMESLERIDS